MLRFFCICAVLFASSAVHADEIHLNDGSKIIGTVKAISGGKVTIKTDFAGDLTVDMAKVKGVTTAEALNVQLDSGDKPVAKLQYDPAAGTQAVQGEVVGNRPVELKQVTGSWPKGEEDPAIVAARPKWKVRLDLGINGQSGNSEILNVNGGLVVKREAPADRITLYLLGRYSRDHGDRTANEIIGGANWEVDLTDRLFWYLKGELEQDEFENLDLRATVATGLGYFLIREKDVDLKVRGGIGYQHESFDNGDSDDKAIAELGVDFRLDIAPCLQYVHSTTVYPSLEDIADVRVVMTNAVEIPLVSDKRWKLKLGVKHQYDAQPESGVDRLDTFYFANIGVDF
jgi:putative salt-induced outer membrane protein YdiY